MLRGSCRCAISGSLRSACPYDAAVRQLKAPCKTEQEFVFARLASILFFLIATG